MIAEPPLSLNGRADECDPGVNGAKRDPVGGAVGDGEVVDRDLRTTIGCEEPQNAAAEAAAVERRFTESWVADALQYQVLVADREVAEAVAHHDQRVSGPRRRHGKPATWVRAPTQTPASS
jgi:hypothetical protein